MYVIGIINKKYSHFSQNLKMFFSVCVQVCDMFNLERRSKIYLKSRIRLEAYFT